MNRWQKNLLLAWVILVISPRLVHAETIVWSEDFESGATNRWAFTNGVWHVGKPTSGPSNAHSGTNCASTQNYIATGQDVRLICTNYNGANSLAVPGANQFPRLRLWHWFYFTNALGYVEVRIGTNGWQQISPTFGPTANASGGGIWSSPSYDLSTYAGQSVQVALHFTSGGCCGNGQGWYVDDMALVTDAPVFNNPEGFEFGLGDWAATAGSWEVGKPTSGPNAAHSGTNCAGTVLSGNYPNSADSRFISPPFFVPPTNNPSLHFWQWCSFNNALGYVEISTDGSTWNSLSTTNLNGNTANIWTNVSLSLSAYGGQTVRIAFHFTSGGSGTAAGWYVDDVMLAVNPVLITPPTTTNYPGQTLSLTNFATNGFLSNAKFTYGAPGGSTNYFIDAISGVLTWTNTGIVNGILTWTNNSVAPGTNTISVVATDDSLPPLSVTNSFKLVFVPPPAPVLNAVNVTNHNGLTWSVPSFAAATNSYLPLATFNFSLVSSSTNYWLSNAAPSSVTNTGVLFWTNAAGGASIYTNFVVVTDNSRPPLAATNLFLAVIFPPFTVNCPELAFLHSGQTTNWTISATDVNLPGSMFTYGLPVASTNYFIDAISGVLTWTNTGIVNGILTWTNNSVAPGTNTISVVATDDSLPPLSVTNSFKLVFVPPFPPNLVVPANRTIRAGQTFSATNLASDGILSNAVFAFSTISTNITLNSSNGVLVWTNNAALPTNYTIAISVTNISAFPLLWTGPSNFVVTVMSPSSPRVTGSPTNSNFKLSFTGWTNTVWRVDASTNLTNWQPLWTNIVDGSGNFQFTDSSTNFPAKFYRAVLQ
jgi:hypothetical protein